MAVIEQIVVKFLGDEFLDGDVSTLDPRVSLLETGVIDSLGLFRLVAFLEETFGFVVEPEHLLAENFETIETIADYVRSRVETKS